MPNLAPTAPEVRIPPRDTAVAEHTLRLDIQGLRALAVSLVILSHAGVSQFSGGYVGVDVFFVISGFLITSLLLRELSTTGGISIRKFYARRALRLLPASTLVVIATLGGAWLFLSQIRFAEYVGDALSSAFYAVNLRLAIVGTDYLAQGSPPSPFQHFWSLAVEEQFYLLWPLLLLVSWKLIRRRAFMAAPLVVLSLVSFGLSVSLTESSPSWAYFGSHTRIWELGIGALLAIFVTRLEQIPAWISAPMTWIGLAGIVLAAVWFDDNTPFPGYYALLPVLGTALVLGGGSSPARFDARLVLARKPVTWIGGLSYGWYLWHWPFLIIGPAALHRTATVPLGLALCAVALLVAWVTLHLVENPVRFHSVFRGRHNRALGLGLGLSAGVAAISLIAAAFPPPIESGGTAPALKSIATAKDPQARLTELLQASGERLPSNLTPPLTKITENRSKVYRDKCHVDYVNPQPKLCEYGDPSSDRTVVLFGDSHAAQWFPAVDRLARERHWKLVSMTKASCKTAEVTIIRKGKPYASCDTWRHNALAMINDLHPALVLVASSEAGDPIEPMSDARQGWADGFRETFQALTDTGAQVATILDTPWPRGDALDCAAKHPLQLGECANHLPEAIEDPIRRDAIRDAAKSTHVSVIDPEPWLCTPTGNCPVVAGDTLIYRDDSHIAEAFAEFIAPVLGDRLTELFGADLQR